MTIIIGMQRTRRTKIFIAVIILSAIIVFFTWRVYDPATQTRSFQFVTNGTDYFRQGLDISGWSRLVYQIDYSKYREIYTDYLELEQVQQNIEQIILQNIDKRISSLGVSDYRSFIQIMDNERYVVVELGWVSDIEEAKKIIGRTVELEFRLPNKNEASPETLAARKSLAENLFVQAQGWTDLNELAANRSADGIYVNRYNWASAAELPSIYQDNIQLLSNMATWTVYSQLLEGAYHSSEANTLEWFTFFKLVDRQVVDNAALTAPIAMQAAAANGLDYEQTFTLSDPGVGFDDYSYSNNTITYNIGHAFSGSYVYDTRIVIIEKQPTIGQTQEQIDIENERVAWIVSTVRDQIRTDAINENQDALVVYDGWIDSDSIRETIPGFTDSDEAVREFDDINFTFVVYNRAVKQPTDTLYEVLEIANVNASAFASFENALQSTTRYTIQDIFVQNTEARIPALDTKTNRVLNGTYFSMASVGSSQLGKPVVLVQFDSQGQEIFCSITDANIGNQMAIFVGGELITSPVIQDRICGGTAQIDGDFTGPWAKELADSLNDGTLPAPLMIKQEEKIDATLWANALQGALLAMLIWLVVIILFMYYMFGRRKALTAALTLLTFLIILSAFIKLVDYALSLSAIAAVVLSLGMAVDANVIIYERIREELRNGKKIWTAINTWYEMSRSAIRDGNVSTGLIALLLFTLGLNMFKWFGSMMIINILIVVFICVPFIKEILHMLFHRKDAFLSEEGRWLEVKEAKAAPVKKK